MIVWLLKKTCFMLLSLVVVITLAFILMKSIPGDPFLQEQALPKQIYEALLQHYGLDQPLITQYWVYLKEVLTLNFGPSLIYKGYDVNTIIREGFPISMMLGIEALLIAIPCGISLGILAATKAKSWVKKGFLATTMLGISMPSFIVAACLQYVIAIKWELLPIARWGSFAQTILPAISLALLPTAFIARLTRTNLIKELKEEYIQTARAKGLPEHIVIFRHALRNAITPVISYIGPLAANIFTGSFIVEKIYSIPGLGYWFVSSVTHRDYPVIMGITVFYCSLVLLTSLIVDCIYAYLDPRVGLNLQKNESL